MLINVRQPFTVEILIMNTKLQILYLSSTELERVDFMKDLGVVFDSELSFALLVRYFPVRHFPVLHIPVLQIQLSCVTAEALRANIGSK